MMAKKMKLISEDEYKTLVSHSLPKDVLENSFTTKEHQKGILLNTNSIPDDIKLAMYMNIVRECQSQIEHIQKKPIAVSVSVSKKETDGEQMPKVEIKDKTQGSEVESPLNFLETIPEKYRESASFILSMCRDKSDLISWDNFGIVSFNGIKEPGTNIVDLVSFLVRGIKWTNQPKGINRFMEICKKIHIPATLVRKAIRKEFTETDHKSPNHQSSSQTLEEYDVKQKLHNWITKEEQSDDEVEDNEEFEDADF